MFHVNNSSDYPYSKISKHGKKSNFSKEYLLSNVFAFLFTGQKREEMWKTYLYYLLFCHILSKHGEKIYIVY